VPTAVLEGMQSVLPPDAQVWTPYGATECLPVASIGSREVLAQTAAQTAAGQGVCVGHVLAANDVRIIAVHDGPIEDWTEVRELPDGEIGEITVHGPTTTLGYHGRPQATRLAKIRRGDVTVHRMGDCGWRDAQGRLWYSGRMSQRVEAEGLVLHTAPVEEVFNRHPAVRRTALVGVTLRGERQAWLCVEREAAMADVSEAELFASLRQLGAQTPATACIRGFLVHPQFPVDVRHNAKIGREFLAQWAQRQLEGRR
jgi:acyl-CoA synthetase (AMP-forming)/AMP-acid ligase II